MMLDEWLDYAWDVARCDHLEKCRTQGGGAVNNGCNPRFPDLRYPGYVGTDYQPGGVLCVGMVHNGRALFAGSFIDAEAATKEWLDTSRANDDAYVSGLRTGYEGVLAGWGPWEQLGEPTKIILGVATDQEAIRRIAFTNVAKCWTIPRTGSDSKVMSLCKRKVPMKRLVRILMPSVVLAWGISIPDLDWGFPPNERTRRVFKMYAARGDFSAGSLHNGDPLDKWAHDAQAVYREGLSAYHLAI